MAGQSEMNVPANTCHILPNGIVVKHRSGEEYKFVVWGRDRIIERVNQAIQGNKN
ncbi:hypothetical protein [Paenibacillus sp. sgz500958]|uniref:hypothetical protein n=1 Tax=Paenibacillus sp. sgz500958 TaxID=3242475 RepID=UPI0036D2E217